MEVSIYQRISLMKYYEKELRNTEGKLKHLQA